MQAELNLNQLNDHRDGAAVRPHLLLFDFFSSLMHHVCVIAHALVLSLGLVVCIQAVCFGADFDRAVSLFGLFTSAVLASAITCSIMLAAVSGAVTSVHVCFVETRDHEAVQHYNHTAEHAHIQQQLEDVWTQTHAIDTRAVAQLCEDIVRVSEEMIEGVSEG